MIANFKTMAFREAHGVLIAVHTGEAPNDEEWEAYVAFCQRLPKSCDKTLVVTEGGGPNAKQRQELNERYLKHVMMTVAVVTPSQLVRGIVTALSWFNPRIKAFAPGEGSRDGVFGALDYLGVRSGFKDGILAEVRKMQFEMAQGQPAVIAR